ncbi:hypothetical protein, partial [Sphingobacterium sp. IITKGP-BTPF85]|uniref:hypothetical protein n=1 Tax=Sphingobacterium sp. IITKGP-BTPF85 TaxID=1338009 RepID=UPI00055BAE23
MYALASAGKAGTAEFNELLNKTASLKQQVILVDEAVDALSTNKLGAFISVSENMAGAFQGVTGALQLMGIESTTAEASIAKLMQLQSIVQGLQSINQFRKQWTALIASVKAGKVATDTINTITTATNEGAEASK